MGNKMIFEGNFERLQFEILEIIKISKYKHNLTKSRVYFNAISKHSTKPKLYIIDMCNTEFGISVDNFLLCKDGSERLIYLNNSFGKQFKEAFLHFFMQDGEKVKLVTNI